MSLFIRLETGYWTHRKTMRLRAILGDAALWLPPRLWSYAAEHQPNGDFADYLPPELAMLLGYMGDAQAMLQALQACGFMDGMKLHGWKERNSYHTVFADRAKKAAAARWDKEKEKKQKREDKRREEKSEAMLQASPSIRSKGGLDEVKAFAVEIGMPESDGEACFHKWEGNGWQNGKSAIKDWRATIRSWKASGYLPSQRQNEKPHRRTSSDLDAAKTGIHSENIPFKRL